MIEVRLRYVHECSFVRGEHTNYDLWREIADEEGRPQLRPGEAVALVSKMGNQVSFVYRPGSVTTPGGDTIRVTCHARVRLHKVTFMTPAILQEAANSVGLTIKGFKAFQSYYKRRTS